MSSSKPRSARILSLAQVAIYSIEIAELAGVVIRPGREGVRTVELDHVNQSEMLCLRLRMNQIRSRPYTHGVEGHTVAPLACNLD